MFIRNSCALAAFCLLAFITLQTNGQANSYSALVEEIKQWQLANPYVCGQDTTTCGVQRLMDRFEECDGYRIINGCDVTKPGTMGWQVAVKITGISTDTCGGTLVSSRHVVLSAACFRFFNGPGASEALSSVTVIMGALSINQQPATTSQQPQIYEVMAVATHPRYLSGNMNVTIIKLARSIKFSTSPSASGGIRPACLPSKTTSRSFKNCIISGYGIESTSPLSGIGILRYTLLQGVSSLVCTYFHGSSFNVFSGFCAIGEFHGANSDTCLGDTGSGLICKDENSGRWTLQGISGSHKCGRVPSLYADVFALGLRSPPSILKPNDQCKPSPTISNAAGNDAATYWDNIILGFVARESDRGDVLATRSKSYKDLADEIQVWQRFYPDACGKDTPACGVNRLIDQFEDCNGFRITGGCEVSKQDVVGWSVSIEMSGGSCSGSLVSSRHIVTAAHCFNPPNPFSKGEDITIVIGAIERYAATEQQRYKAESLAIHPQYRAGMHDFDSAVVRLSREVTFTASGIRPVCLPSHATPRTFSQCVVAGYGLNNSLTEKGSGTLRYNILQGVNDEACAYYSSRSAGNPRMFCALGYRHGGITDTCSGDSGGGVICKDDKLSVGPFKAFHGPPQCGKRPGVYADAYVLGIQAPQEPHPPLKTECPATTASSPGKLTAALDDVVGSIKRDKPLTASNSFTDALVVNRLPYNQLLDEIKNWHSSNPGACGHDTTTCGVQRMVDRYEVCDQYRIINGCDVRRQTTMGWQVAILVNYTICSGTLMSPRHVVLAASCMRRLAAQVVSSGKLSVSSGAADAYDPAILQNFEANAFGIHTQFTKGSSNYDVAIVKLERDVPFAVSGSRPACLPSSKATRSFTQCIIGGYGINDAEEDTGLGRLRYAVLQPISDSACNYFYGPELQTDGRLFDKSISYCAIGARADEPTDTCYGDIGSGLMCKDDKTGRWALQGILGDAPKGCGLWPGLYADAFAIGFQHDPAKRQLSADPCKSTTTTETNNLNDEEGSISSSTNMTKYMDDFVAQLRQRQKVDETQTSSKTTATQPAEKKAGGVAKTATRTIRDFGCKSNDECQSSTCKPVELCVGPERKATGQNKVLITGKPLNESFRSDSARPDDQTEDENVLKQFSFVARGSDKRCARVDVCWPGSWLKFYASKLPAFNLMN